MSKNRQAIRGALIAIASMCAIMLVAFLTEYGYIVLHQYVIIFLIFLSFMTTVVGVLHMLGVIEDDELQGGSE